MTTQTHKLNFQTPPRNQGQIVTVSYATTGRGAQIERRHDASDGQLRYYWLKSGRRLNATELARYELTEVN